MAFLSDITYYLYLFLITESNFDKIHNEGFFSELEHHFR